VGDSPEASDTRRNTPAHPPQHTASSARSRETRENQQKGKKFEQGKQKREAVNTYVFLLVGEKQSQQPTSCVIHHPGEVRVVKKMSNEADADKQTENSDATKPEECPECGGTIYREPNICHGTQYEATSGWACMDCTWSKIDPSSGRELPREAARGSANEQLASMGPCPDCESQLLQLGRRAVLDDNGDYIRDDNGEVEVERVVECGDCRTIVDGNPSPKVVGLLGATTQ
jgi:hypothetical protein